ncbi:hypothetical protein RF11_10244 [Thelohanellus kitauei]|uniref:Uncharacterized protein n=1 Tax=Thelohanellus kitauei TaxID=669202 RepID=A0A0C2MXW6_THEKT|nr:hypothetical protein RF11_10244 [Thelohanellus kitauei]
MYIFAKKGDNVKIIRKIANKHLTGARTKQRFYYDRCVGKKVYNIGDRVFMMTKTKSKLGHSFERPFIVEKASHPMYTLSDPLRQSKLPSKRSFNRLFKGSKHTGESYDSVSFDKEPPILNR